MAVKLAASISVCLNASRQSSELPAKAAMDSDVRIRRRAGNMSITDGIGLKRKRVGA